MQLIMMMIQNMWELLCLFQDSWLWPNHFLFWWMRPKWCVGDWETASSHLWKGTPFDRCEAFNVLLESFATRDQPPSSPWHNQTALTDPPSNTGLEFMCACCVGIKLMFGIFHLFYYSCSGHTWWFSDYFQFGTCSFWGRFFVVLGI